MTLRCPVSGRKFESREYWQTATDRPPVLTKRELFSAEQVLVADRSGSDVDTVRSRLRALGLVLKEHIADGLYTVVVPSDKDTTAAGTIDRINASAGSALQARPDFIGFGGAVPNDPIFADTYGGGWGQWNLRNSGSGSSVRSKPIAGADIAATSLWQVVQSSPGVTIAVLDSGVRTNHPDFAGISWRGTNIISSNADFSDDNGHGTGVVGIIAANRDNGTGIAGLIGPADYLIVRVLQNTVSNTTSGSTSDLIKGLGFARSNGATVINMSLQGYPEDSGLRTEITKCEAAGILLVICAGNDGSNTDTAPNFPSSFTNANILSVGSHDWTDARWKGGNSTTDFPSNFGATSVDVFAPGAYVPSPDLSRSYGEYSWWTGTSFAAPHVTAVAAMIKSLNPSWTAPQIKQAILSSVTTNANYAGLCVSGGRLDALGAVGRAVTGGPTNDLDADGFGNLMEYLAGTRADGQASQPAIDAVRDASGFSLTMPRAMRPYAKLVGQQSTNLQLWTTNGVTNGGSDSLFRASIPHNGTAGFLRAVAVPLP
jgi:subtilisin family serine protease